MTDAERKVIEKAVRITDRCKWQRGGQDMKDMRPAFARPAFNVWTFRCANTTRAGRYDLPRVGGCSRSGRTRSR